MSITYPFTINNEKELSQHIQTHIQTYKNLYNYLLSDKLHKLQLQNNELVNVISLQKSSTGTHSNNKGKLFESNIQHLVTKLIEDNIDWQIDCNKNITKCMDVRLIYKGEYTVGIECKDKKIITQKDITKFQRDKTNNKFIGNIFISTNPIPNILQNEGIHINNNELFIFSNNYDDISKYITFYLKQTESSINNNIKDHKTHYHDIIRVNYTDFQFHKKTLRETDKRLLLNIKELDDYDSLKKGHIYFTTISNCKRCPY